MFSICAGTLFLPSRKSLVSVTISKMVEKFPISTFMPLYLWTIATLVISALLSVHFFSCIIRLPGDVYTQQFVISAIRVSKVTIILGNFF